MSNWDKIYENLYQDIKLTAFILAVIGLFRVAFIMILHSYLSTGVTAQDIMAALYYGTRISLKSAGLLGLISFILCWPLQTVLRDKVRYVRLALGTGYLGLLSILFYARIPYYRQFHSGFNQLIFNTFKDDVAALWQTLIQQYNLPLRLTLAAVTTLVLARLLMLWLGRPIKRLPHFNHWYKTLAARAALLTAVYYLAVFMRFGGSMTYAYNIDWENSGVTNDQLLNEAILDDLQALYRAYELHERLRSSTGLAVDPEQLRQYAKAAAERPLNSDSLDDYLQKTAVGTNRTPPRHVFLIISESYANWPLLPEYENLNVAGGLRRIISQPDADYVGTFLPNGMSTISGVMGIITGFTDANLYLNYLPQTYEQPYPTAIAPQMQKVGYQPKFWYAGPSSWEKIKDFTLAQGFTEFYDLGDYDSTSGNVWGCDDQDLFNAVLNRISNNQPSFNVILTVSNHSPYTVDLAQAGFNADQIAAALPEKLRKDQELIKQLGHFWYADKVMSEFIAAVRTQYPDSLFMIVGDHADRLNLEHNPGLYRRYAVPFIVYGPGITKDTFPANAAGSHINVAPTLLELTAPAGFKYYAVGDSLTRGNTFGMNYGFWITSDDIGLADRDSIEAINPKGVKPDLEQVQTDIAGLRALSWWRITRGDSLMLPMPPSKKE